MKNHVLRKRGKKPTHRTESVGERRCGGSADSRSCEASRPESGWDARTHGVQRRFHPSLTPCAAYWAEGRCNAPRMDAHYKGLHDTQVTTRPLTVFQGPAYWPAPGRLVERPPELLELGARQAAGAAGTAHSPVHCAALSAGEGCYPASAPRLAAPAGQSARHHPNSTWLRAKSPPYPLRCQGQWWQHLRLVLPPQTMALHRFNRAPAFVIPQGGYRHARLQGKVTSVNNIKP